MALTKIPSYTALIDGQFIQVEGPNSVTTGYSYDSQQRALYFKESQVLYPSFHGFTHIAEDPVPNATCDTPGLMSQDDKCKLDALLQTRLGVLGFQGAGFPDDGGWMQGDIILAAGTEFISLERIGNVVRFTVDSPIPLNCACEECTQIFWVQDETDIASIRPPSCAGKLPGVNAYGEVKVYLFPESVIADPNNVAATLNNKGSYPALIFKRYDDAITPGAAEFELILKRDGVNATQTEIGWAFTPGATGMVECVWFTGKDNDGNLTKFELEPSAESNLLGSLLYKGHLITRKTGVIVDYTSSILSTNQYTVREWDTDGSKAVGDAFTARNIWQFQNPENSTSGPNAISLILDSSIDLLPIGTIVDIWWFKVGEIAGEPIRRYYFSKRPSLNPNHMWTSVGQVQFGDLSEARSELAPSSASTDASACEFVSSVRSFERSLWGLTGLDDPLFVYDIESDGGTIGTAGSGGLDISSQHRAEIDTDLPGMKVVGINGTGGDFSERPVVLWNRRNICNALVRFDVGCPTGSTFTPYDILLRAPIDEHTEKYMRVVEKGSLDDGTSYIKVCGLHFHDLPQFGAVRILHPTANANKVFNYFKKMAFPASNCTEIFLVGLNEYVGEVGDFLELLHQEYSTTCVRLEFANDNNNISLQVKVGNLSMCADYENSLSEGNTDIDDYVRGMEAGYAVSAIYTQQGLFSGVGNQPTASPDGFVVYNGGIPSPGEDEYWNRVEVMLRDDQVWVWWNRLLIPPSPLLSAALPTPAEDVNTPYFPIDYNPNKSFGKCGIRMFPGASIRRMDLRTQLSTWNEFAYGQIEIV